MVELVLLERLVDLAERVLVLDHCMLRHLVLLAVALALRAWCRVHVNRLRDESLELARSDDGQPVLFMISMIRVLLVMRPSNNNYD